MLKAIIFVFVEERKIERLWRWPHTTEYADLYVCSMYILHQTYIRINSQKEPQYTVNVSIIQPLRYFFVTIYTRRIRFLFNLHNTLSYLHPLRRSSCAHNLRLISIRQMNIALCTCTISDQRYIYERLGTALSQHLPFMLNRQTWIGFNITCKFK